MLTWIKQRVRAFEAFDWDNKLTSRRAYIMAAMEDWDMACGGKATRDKE